MTKVHKHTIVLKANAFILEPRTTEPNISARFPANYAAYAFLQWYARRYVSLSSREFKLEWVHVSPFYRIMQHANKLMDRIQREYDTFLNRPRHENSVRIDELDMVFRQILGPTSPCWKWTGHMRQTRAKKSTSTKGRGKGKGKGRGKRTRGGGKVYQYPECTVNKVHMSPLRFLYYCYKIPDYLFYKIKHSLIPLDNEQRRLLEDQEKCKPRFSQKCQDPHCINPTHIEMMATGD